jgi:hypothetical protein
MLILRQIWSLMEEDELFTGVKPGETYSRETYNAMCHFNEIAHVLGDPPAAFREKYNPKRDKSKGTVFQYRRTSLMIA